jgi:protein-S-isoprenylcysteine O-methyltransferase Ste14
MFAHNNLFQTSDFITYTFAIFALILEWLLPTDLNLNQTVSILASTILLIFSWTIILIAKCQFKENSQKSGPNHETTKIIKTGLFTYTRNPIYLGAIFLAPALGLIINSLWMITAIIPIFIFIQIFLIIPEEKYLSIKFGDEYFKYCKKVRRWI